MYNLRKLTYVEHNNMRFFNKLQAMTFFSILLASFICEANEPLDSLMDAKSSFALLIEHNESFQKELYNLRPGETIDLTKPLNIAKNQQLTAYVQQMNHMPIIRDKFTKAIRNRFDNCNTLVQSLKIYQLVVVKNQKKHNKVARIFLGFSLHPTGKTQEIRMFSAFYGDGGEVFDSSQRTRTIYGKNAEKKYSGNLEKKQAKAVQRHCAACGLQAERKCPCDTFYCSQECQKKDWESSHMHTCEYRKTRKLKKLEKHGL